VRDIGDRMKANYEDRSRHLLVRRMPVVVRVDGKAFHTFTRGMAEPFDGSLVTAMVSAAQRVAEEMQGFKVGYIQSDEASFLLTDYDGLQTEAWFGYVKSKVETISASVMTAAFNLFMGDYGCRKLAHFDARAFNIPREEVVNYFLWRALDWERNSVAMYCGAFHSSKQMHGQGKSDQHEMLHKLGKNWATDLNPQLRNGTWIFGDGCSQTDIVPSYATLAPLIDQYVNCDRSCAAIGGVSELREP
jgi:tRNA(His) guanylyltransferase